MTEQNPCATVVFNETDELSLPVGTSLQGPCEEQGVPFACTEGICGTCLIEVSEGMDCLNPKTQEELDFLGDIPTCERLACQCKIARAGKLKIQY